MFWMNIFIQFQLEFLANFTLAGLGWRAVITAALTLQQSASFPILSEANPVSDCTRQVIWSATGKTHSWNSLVEMMIR